MPRISWFLGIEIYMYFNDHLPPHFHAEYGEFEAAYEIETLENMRGKLPRRVHAAVVEWALANRTELRANWARAREQIPLLDIAPLE